MKLNSHHRWMAFALTVTFVLVIALGALYGVISHAGVWDGIYFAIVTVTSVGYGDLAPHGWAEHLVALAIMVLVIPAWTGSFSLLTSGLMADHIDKRHNELKGMTDGKPERH